VAKNGADSHQRHVARIEKRCQPQRFEMATANAEQLDVAARLPLHRPDEIGAQQIARFLAGHDGDAQGSFSLHAPPPRVTGAFGGRPMTNRPSSSALPIISGPLNTRELPASTAIPARPAACASSTVRGPMDG